MNKTQQRILFQLKSNTKSRPLSISSLETNLGINQTSLLQELDALERNGYIELVRNERGKVKRVNILEIGLNTYHNSTIISNNVDLQQQVRELKELVETLQQAVNDLEKGKPNKEIIDKLNSYTTIGNNVISIFKTVLEASVKLL